MPLRVTPGRLCQHHTGPGVMCAIHVHRLSFWGGCAYFRRQGPSWQQWCQDGASGLAGRRSLVLEKCFAYLLAGLPHPQI